MAKKKNITRKHKFKYSEPVSHLATPGQPSSTFTATSTSAAGAQFQQRDFSYVARDMRRLAIIAAALVSVEVILWYVLGHTPVGNSVYRMFNV